MKSLFFQNSGKVNRSARVAEVLKSVFEEVLSKSIQDDRIGFHTITHVEVTQDLSLAKIYVSTFGSDQQKNETFSGLCRALKKIRMEVAKQLNYLRKVPQLQLIHDDSLEKGDRVLNKLKELQKEREAREEQND